MLKEDSSEEALNSDLERIERSIARLGANKPCSSRRVFPGRAAKR